MFWSPSRELFLVRGLRQWMPLSVLSLTYCKSESIVNFHKIHHVDVKGSGGIGLWIINPPH
jgi:hypothetical protein